MKNKKKYKFVQKEELVQNKLKGGDAELDKFVDDMVKNDDVIDLVKLMEPMDIASVIAKDFSLCPRDAAAATVKIFQKAEGLKGPAIETNKEYPVPPILKKKKTDVDESMLGRPDGKVDVTPKLIVRPGEVIPDKRRNPDDEWPYGDYTRAVMDPKTKSPKRPLMMSNSPVKKKFVFKQDLTLNQPGGDGAGGKGIYQTTRQGDGSMPGSGRSWVAKGTAPGWASSPSGKEFDPPPKEKKKQYDPIEQEPDAELEEYDPHKELNIEKDAPVGSAIPNFGFDTKTPDTRKGFRRK